MDTDKTIVSKAGPADLIATAWFRLGFRPRQSLVLAGLEGPRQRVGVVLRAGLPPPGAGPERGLVADLLAAVRESGAAGVAVLIVDEQALISPLPPVGRLLIGQARRRGLELLDVLGQTSSAYRSLLCADPACCPPGGRLLAEVLASRAAAVHVLEGRALADSEQELVADVLPGGAALRAGPAGGVTAGAGPLSPPALAGLERGRAARGVAPSGRRGLAARPGRGPARSPPARCPADGVAGRHRRAGPGHPRPDRRLVPARRVARPGR